MADPEKLFNRLVAGNPRGIREVARDIGAQDPVVITALDHVTVGIGGTRWSSALASLPAHLASRSVYVDGTMVAWRLHRAAGVLDDLASDLQSTEEWARKIIAVWRQQSADLSPADEADLRDEVCLALAFLSLGTKSRLQSAAADLTTFDPDVVDWLRDGAGGDFDLGVKYGGQRGPRIPDGAANDDGDGWTPQGLVHDGNGHFVTTSYQTDPGTLDDKTDDVDRSQLSVIDDETGKVINQVQLTGLDGTAGPQHSGGVAVAGNRVYVVGGGRLYEYSMADIRRAGPGAPVEPVGMPKSVGNASSYVTIANGQMFLGNWRDSEVTAYDLDANSGQVLFDDPTVFKTPEGTNGIAVLPDGRHVYSVNDGRATKGQLIVDNAPVAGALHEDEKLEIGNLPEELALVDGHIVVTTEAGADDYAPWDEDGRKGKGDDGVGDTGGSEGTDAENFWAQTHLQNIPIGVLDGKGADGFYVEPITLVAGAKEVWQTEAGLTDARLALSGVHLPASLLPDLPGSPLVASAASARLGSERTELARLAEASDRIGNSLKDTADDYTMTDLFAAVSVQDLARKLVEG